MLMTLGSLRVSHTPCNLGRVNQAVASFFVGYIKDDDIPVSYKTTGIRRETGKECRRYVQTYSWILILSDKRVRLPAGNGHRPQR